jgi:hypothetical protein
MKTSSSFLFKCLQYIRGTLLGLVCFSVATIRVFADPPTVTIVQPAEGAAFAGPVDVTIEATVIDSDDVVTQVDFSWSPCGRTTLLASFTAPPYKFTITNVLSGSYQVQVLAFGDMIEFSTVNFSVVGPIQSLVNAAAPGSTVDIPAGVYLDSVVVNKNLTLRGAGARITTIDGNNECAADRCCLGKALGTVTIAAGATVTMSGLTLTQGGILNSGTLTVNDCAITGNNTFTGFSGVENTISGALFMNNCTVSGNKSEAVDGGGVNNFGTMILNGCTISGNFSGVGKFSGDDCGGFGGGLLNLGTLSLNNCTVTGNIANTGRFCGGSGGGIANFAPGTVNCKSTIIANNFGLGDLRDPTTLSPDFYGNLNSQGYNLIGNTAGAVISGITTGNLLNLDPLLGPLQNNGGPTDTHALLTGSPALDAGISGGPNTDQRGFPRPFDIPSLPNAADGSDIGAYEFNSGAPPVNITCPTDIAANDDPGQCSAVVNYPAPMVSGGTGNVVVVCNPLSGSVFPVGTTTVTCTATDTSGATAVCSFNVTINDTEPPKGSCAAVIPFQILQNPLRKVGRLQLLASDNCDPDPKIYIGDSRSSFVAGPFHSLDQVEIGAGPSLTPNQHAPARGPNVAVVFTKGEPLLWVVDSAGNGSTPIKCK